MQLFSEGDNIPQAIQGSALFKGQSILTFSRASFGTGVSSTLGCIPKDVVFAKISPLTLPSCTSCSEAYCTVEEMFLANSSAFETVLFAMTTFAPLETAH